MTTAMWVATDGNSTDNYLLVDDPEVETCGHPGLWEAFAAFYGSKEEWVCPECGESFTFISLGG